MNGRKLTKAQITKVARIESLFAQLKADGVNPLIIEGGGNPTLCFLRDADLSIEALERGRWSREAENYYHSTNTKIDMWVP
jgi:hypothetical protein